MVLVANCGEVIPPFVRLGAGIRPDDGLLDVVVMRANSFGQSVRAVWDLLRDGARGEGMDTFVGYARGREIRVESDPVQPVQLDGEPGGDTPFTATVVPGAIRIMVPSGEWRGSAGLFSFWGRRGSPERAKGLLVVRLPLRGQPAWPDRSFSSMTMSMFYAASATTSSGSATRSPAS